MSSTKHLHQDSLIVFFSHPYHMLRDECSLH
jgi:hypothetical protein